VDTYGTARAKTGYLSEQDMAEIVRTQFDLTPDGIIATLDLRRPQYRATAAYGHLGQADFSWEQTNPELVRRLQEAILIRNEEIKRNREEKLELRKRAFSAMSNSELIEAFNKGEGSGAWIPLRMQATRLLMEELQRRHLDLSEICDVDPLSGLILRLLLETE